MCIDYSQPSMPYSPRGRDFESANANRKNSPIHLRLPRMPSISAIEGQPQRAIDMAVTRLRPSISEIEGQPQPGTRRIDAIRGPSISEIEGQPQLGSTMTGCLGSHSI